MEIKGTFEDGKVYRGNGRWAKVMTTRCIKRVSVAFGREGEAQAFEVWSTAHGEATLTRKEADQAARDFILHDD